MRWKFLLLTCLCHVGVHATDAPRRTALTLLPDDVIDTGNEWLALPDIRAADGALTTFIALCRPRHLPNCLPTVNLPGARRP
jgi:hypothetical protein